MAVSKTSICNKALRKLGANVLMNVDTDTSREATLCKASYNDVLLEVLRMHNWNFAIFRQSLNKSSTVTPTYEFSYSYILPTNPIFVRLIEVENNPVYRTENNYLLSNETSINIRFVGKETDPNKYDSLFVNTLACRLAIEIGYTLTSDEGRINRIENEFREYLSLARERDNQEDNDVADTSSSFNTSRLSGFNFSIDNINA